MQAKYSAMTSLPRHLEEKLLEFNILQLCALVSEKSGNRWTGASDQYGPIQEIARRWKLDELCLRIAEIKPEDPLRTYAKIMTAIGGNPAKEAEIEKREAIRKAVWDEKTKPLEQDEVRVGLAACQSVDDLKRVAKEQSLAVDWGKVEGLANFGLKRMYLGNKWRHKLKVLKQQGAV
jgi:hypothetical protein